MAKKSVNDNIMTNSELLQSNGINTPNMTKQEMNDNVVLLASQVLATDDNEYDDLMLENGVQPTEEALTKIIKTRKKRTVAPKLIVRSINVPEFGILYFVTCGNEVTAIYRRSTTELTKFVSMAHHPFFKLFVGMFKEDKKALNVIFELRVANLAVANCIASDELTITSLISCATVGTTIEFIASEDNVLE